MFPAEPFGNGRGAGWNELSRDEAVDKGYLREGRVVRETCPEHQSTMISSSGWNSRGGGASRGGERSVVGAGRGSAPISSIPSSMLEQEAQTLGFLDKACPLSAMGSPQQMQI